MKTTGLIGQSRIRSNDQTSVEELVTRLIAGYKRSGDRPNFVKFLCSKIVNGQRRFVMEYVCGARLHRANIELMDMYQYSKI